MAPRLPWQGPTEVKVSIWDPKEDSLWAWCAVLAMGGVTCQRRATDNLELARGQSPGKIPLLPWKGVSTLSLEVCKGVPWR